ncbi:MAG: glycosyltransferase family 4 protein, partial [Patescibacteria group bacterium]|nr:glycosyltransferase family 4 protein [Patescibacteria group bacterium]
QADKVKMKSLVKGLKVEVVPNGAGEDLMEVWLKRKPEKVPTIFFQANFDWLQNIEAAQNLATKVFPLVKEKLPQARCWIVGQGAAGKIGNLETKDLKVIDLKNSDINGVVDAYKRATVFVAPLEGPGGTRLKILAAMAAGVPVVTSQVGIEGIDANDGKEVLIAKSYQEMANKIVSLIHSKKKYQELVFSARKLVEEKYSYQSIAQILDKIYREVANGKA